MRSYKGLRNDKVFAGGDYIKQHGYGHEIFNFSPIKGKYYGYVAAQGNININRLGAKDTDEYIKNVTVVWTATKKYGGTYIVGWYKNGTVFRESPTQPRKFRNEQMSYYAECRLKDATLLTEDERVVEVPRGENGMGQKNIWYADNNNKFVSTVNNYIFKGIIPTVKSRTAKRGRPFQVDSIKRKKIETAAIRKVFDYFDKLGYTVKSVEEEKVGWDLEVTKGKTNLLLEVKGLSSDEISIELTPNEYRQMLLKKNNFRLCVVTNALKKPTEYIFSYSETEKIWTDTKRDKELNFNEVISARITTN